MTRVATRIRFRGETIAVGDAQPLLVQSGDVVIVVREHPRWIVMSCPCGCGETLRVNLDRRAGPAWRIWRGPTGLTLYPSVSRNTGCRTHFIVWDDHIWHSGIWPDLDDVADLASTVLRRLGNTGRSALDLADELLVLPWRVTVVLRNLQRRGLVRELPPKSGHFVVASR
jgi:hypothetical protein